MYFHTNRILIGFLLLIFSAAGDVNSCLSAERAPHLRIQEIAGDRELVVAKRSGEILFQGKSEYSSIRIIQQGKVRCLVFGSGGESTQTCINMNRPDESVFEYTAMMFLGFLFHPESKKSCLIGVGGGYIPTVFRMHLPEHQLHMVELDPLVCTLAGKYLGFRTTPNQKLIFEDGRKYLERTKDVYDQILLDAFDSDYVPPHMNTPEFLAICKSKLSPHGVVVQNAHSNHAQYAAQLGAYRKAFANVYVFEGRRSANAVIVAADRPLCRPPGFSGKKGPWRIGRIDLKAEAGKIVPYPGTLSIASDRTSTNSH